MESAGVEDLAALEDLWDQMRANLNLPNSNAGEVGYDVVFTVTLDKVNDTGSDITFDLADTGSGSATMRLSQAASA